MDRTESQPHVTLLQTIRAILTQSDAPFKTVLACIQFVDSLIGQSVEKEKNPDEPAEPSKT